MTRWLLLFALVFVVGCSDGTTMEQRQNQALRDPFNYSPYRDYDPTNVSGGGLTDFNKDAFKKDLNSVLNP